MAPTFHKLLDKTDFVNNCLVEFWSGLPVKLFTVGVNFELYFILYQFSHFGWMWII